jgi:hypothetical protein
MTDSVLQRNLARLLKEQDIQVHELERMAGLKKNNVYYILKGISKKPSAEIIQSIASTLGVSINDLLENPVAREEIYLTDKHTKLITDIIQKLEQQRIASGLKLKYSQLISLVGEVYNYALTSGVLEADEKFIRWTLQNYAIKHKLSKGS